MVSKHIFAILMGIHAVRSDSCTSQQVYSHLDTNNDGIITFSEVENIVDKSYLPIKNDVDECSCFRCDGTHFQRAVICDVYDNSGCTNGDSRDNCYTTNIKKCECNFYSKNVYVCKIPLTHSFENYTENPINYNVKMDEENINRRSSHGNMEKRCDSSYKNDRNTEFDFVDLMAGYIIGDTIGTALVDILVGKD